MVSATLRNGHFFRLFRPEASRVELSGNFTDWDANRIELSKTDDGWWEIELDLLPGDYEFQYVIDHHIRLADFAANGVKLNGFGQWVSLLMVADKPETPVVVIGRIGTRAAKAA